MKQAVTLRIDPDLLARAKRAASGENRTLTNFIETILKQHVHQPNTETATRAIRSSQAGRRSSGKRPGPGGDQEGGPNGRH